MRGQLSREVMLELHRRIHAKPKPPTYQPITVTEALHRIKRGLDASVMLGIYSLVAGDHEAAMATIEAERSLDETAYQLMVHVAIAVGRNIEEATKAAPLYTYILAVDKAMDAVKDLASLVIRGYRLSEDVYEEIMALSSMPVARITGRSLGSVGALLDKYGVDVLAVRKGSQWLLDPANDVTIDEGDTVYVWGSKDAVNELLENLGLEPLPEREEGRLRDLVSSIEILPVMNELAHYQLRAQDPLLADEILELEMFMDELREKNTATVLSLDKGFEDKFLLLALITRVEDISDALTYIMVMPAEEEYREVLSSLIEAGEEAIEMFVAGRSVELEALAEALEEFGASILAVRRGREWIAVTPYNLPRLRINSGDTVLVKYEKRVRNRLLAVLRGMGLQPARTGEQEED